MKLFWKRCKLNADFEKNLKQIKMSAKLCQWRDIGSLRFCYFFHVKPNSGHEVCLKCYYACVDFNPTAKSTKRVWERDIKKSCYSLYLVELLRSEPLTYRGKSAFCAWFFCLTMQSVNVLKCSYKINWICSHSLLLNCCFVYYRQIMCANELCTNKNQTNSALRKVN